MSEALIPESRLPGKSTRELRAKAHALKPVVWISDHGASDAVLREIDRALNAHELIKIHAAVDGRAEREALLSKICQALAASPIQIIGKMLVVFRPGRDEPPRPAMPRKSAPTDKSPKGKSTRVQGVNSRASAAGRQKPPRGKRR